MPPEYTSLTEKVMSTLGMNNLMSGMMHASASTIVFMVRADMGKINDEQLQCMRDYIDGHNKHIVRLAEKDVVVGDKAYKYFTMQSTGGGHFPNTYAHPETECMYLDSYPKAQKKINYNQNYIRYQEQKQQQQQRKVYETKIYIQFSVLSFKPFLDIHWVREKRVDCISCGLDYFLQVSQVHI